MGGESSFKNCASRDETASGEEGTTLNSFTEQEREKERVRGQDERENENQREGKGTTVHTRKTRFFQCLHLPC